MLLRPGRGRNHLGPQKPGHLDGRMTHSAAGTMYQSRLTSLQAATLDQAVISRNKGGSKPRRGRHLHRVRHLDQLLFCDDRFLGKSARPMRCHHPVTDVECADVRTGRDMRPADSKGQTAGPVATGTRPGTLGNRHSSGPRRHRTKTCLRRAMAMKCRASRSAIGHFTQYIAFISPLPLTPVFEPRFIERFGNTSTVINIHTSIEAGDAMSGRQNSQSISAAHYRLGPGKGRHAASRQTPDNAGRTGRSGP